MSGSDWVSSHMDTVGIVNGGIGLLTKDTIRKPAYFAVDFLNQLGEYLLDKGQNYIVTRKESEDIYILCFYYSWFRRSYFLQEEDVDLLNVVPWCLKMKVRFIWIFTSKI